MTKKIVLAYSGGLDTSFCIPFFKEKGYDEIHAVSINTGGFSKEELTQMESRAYQLGAAKFECINIEKDYWKKCLKYLLFGNVLRNDVYPVSVSSERPFQALALLKYCKEHQINTFAHGSTGAGNDQIRFDLIFKTLMPEIEIVTPIRDNSLTRTQEIDYLKAKGFDWKDVQKTYSINQGIWGTSVGGKETLTSHKTLPDHAFPTPARSAAYKKVSINFKKGIPVSLAGKNYRDPIKLVRDLEKLAAPYGIGRDIHVGDTIIGIKGRVGFEAAAPIILIKAHHLLEKHTLTKHQNLWKKQLGDWYGMMLHEGQYLEPVMRNIETFLEESQQTVTGEVIVELLPNRFVLHGIKSEFDLMSSDFGKYGEENFAWTGEDAKGFTNILSNPAKIYYAVNKDSLPV